MLCYVTTGHIGGTYHHGNVPTAIEDVALDLIRAVGVEGLSLRKAASQVGVSHAAVYRHFRDKKALLASIAERGFISLRSSLSRAIKRAAVGGVHASLEAAARRYVRFALEDPALYRLMFGPRADQPGEFPALQAAITSSFAAIREPIASGLALEADEAEQHTLRVWTMVHGYCDLVIARRIGAPSTRKAQDHIVALLAPLLESMQPASEMDGVMS